MNQTDDGSVAEDRHSCMTVLRSSREYTGISRESKSECVIIDGRVGQDEFGKMNRNLPDAELSGKTSLQRGRQAVENAL
jgi:hypothetical protein